MKSAISSLHFANPESKYSNVYLYTEERMCTLRSCSYFQYLIYITFDPAFPEKITCNYKHFVYLQYTVYLGRLLTHGLHVVSLCEIICVQHEGSRV